MGDRHLSLDTMAKWLTGRLEHYNLLREVVPHHLEQCSGCRQAYETLEALKQEVGHWDEEVVTAHLGTSRPAAVWGSQSTPAGQKHPGRASNRKSARYLARRRKS